MGKGHINISNDGFHPCRNLGGATHDDETWKRKYPSGVVIDKKKI